MILKSVRWCLGIFFRGRGLSMFESWFSKLFWCGDSLGKHVYILACDTGNLMVRDHHGNICLKPKPQKAIGQKEKP